MRLSYIDSSVLLDAFRGESELAAKAIAVLEDPDRELATSKYVRLEVLPKAICFKHDDEIEFYEGVFSTMKKWAAPTEALVDLAFDEAKAAGLSAVDALHVSAALQLQCDDLVTSEKPSKSIHRTKSIPVVSIR
mgnify:CR=1 FL=1